MSMSEEEIREQQEQMAAAAQLIIAGAQEAQDFKAAGEKALKAAETALRAAESYKVVNDKTVEMVSRRPEAVVPERTYNSIYRSAADGVRETKCKAPTSSDMVPILRQAYEEVGPEIQYKHVFKIHGKLWFWLAVPLLIAAGILFGLNYHRVHFGTPESWANRNYVTAVELNDPNPGNFYDEIIRMFAAGHDGDAKEIVKTREERAKSYGKTAKAFESWISDYLVNVRDFKEGISVISWEQIKENGKKVSFVRFRNLDTQEEWKMIVKASGHVAFTTDESIQTLKDASSKRNSEKRIWRYQGKTTPYVPREGE